MRDSEDVSAKFGNILTIYADVVKLVYTHALGAAPVTILFQEFNRGQTHKNGVHFRNVLLFCTPIRPLLHKALRR